MYILVALLVGGEVGGARGDEIRYAHEGDRLLTSPPDAWSNGDPCIDECTHYVEDGAFVIRWEGGGRRVNYGHRIVEPPDPALPNLWVEWSFASSHPFMGGDEICDGTFIVDYKTIVSFVHHFGDAAMSFGIIEFRGGLELDEFHTYRFESFDGVDWCVSVDGQILFCDQDTSPFDDGIHRVQISGGGGCDVDLQPTYNRYDFVRYGTISFGEAIVSSDPPAGVLGSAEHAARDRFTVTYDAPNFVRIDEITVAVTGGEAPVITKTRRPVNGPPETLEVVLDRPLTAGETTTFTFADGVATNVVAYTVVETGACCQADHTCTVTTLQECDGGTFIPDVLCGEPAACCFAGQCAAVPAACCVPMGGEPSSSGSSCEGDADGDGVDAACGDECPNDPGKVEPGQCGCGNPDTDSDGDGVADCVDQCDGEDDTIDEDGDNIPDCLQFQPIPTTTAWGVGIMSLLLLIGAKLRSIHAT